MRSDDLHPSRQLLRTVSFLFAILFVLCTGLPASSAPSASRGRLADVPLAFEPNRGQADPAVKYVARARGSVILLTGSETVLATRSSALVLRFGDSRPAPMTALHPLAGVSNYFIGSRENWLTGVPTFGQVMQRGIYQGIDVVYYGNQRNLEYDLRVAPGADPSVIRMVFSGAQSIRVAPNGDLLLATAAGEARQLRPVIYQDIDGRRRTVDGEYVLRAGNTVAFELGAYDRTRTLVIDPTISYSTFLGGSGSDEGNAIAADSAGGAYVAGSTTSTNFPVSSAVRGTLAASTDAFITRMNTSGTGVIFSTYFGGNGVDVANGIALDSAGNPVVVGSTTSTNFPVQNAAQGTYRGNTDGFALKLSGSGLVLTYSTYLGGTDADSAAAVAVDLNGNAFITGSTGSHNFPVVNPFQATLGGGTDAFVIRLNVPGAIVSSTYFGGLGADSGRGISLDGSNSVYIGGSTASANLRVASAFRSTLSGGTDGFVTKFDPSVTQVVFSTYIGGSGADVINGVATDPTGSTAFAGTTSSQDLPTAQASQARGGGSDVMVGQLTAAGTGVNFLTYLGGANDESGNSVTRDSDGFIWIAGTTNSPDLRSTDPVQSGRAGSADALVARFSPSGILGVSSYLGGPADDQGRAIAGSASGNVYVTGTTTSSGFPIMPGSFQVNFGGTSDAFVVAINSAAGVSCTWGAFPTSGFHTVSAETGSFTVNTQTGCAWAASTDSDFIVLTTASGVGPSAVTYAVSANPGTNNRGGSIRIGSSVFTLLQQGSSETNPAPSITSISPVNIRSGSGPLQVTITGGGFVPGSQAKWNGADRITTFISPTQLIATLTRDDLAFSGSGQISVTNPPPGGGFSNIVTFQVLSLGVGPVLNSLSPTFAVAGSDALTITVFGTNFTDQSFVQWNGASLPTTFVSGNELRATLTSADIASPGTARVSVLTPNSAASNVLTFTILPPPPAVPRIGAVEPSTLRVGTGDQTLTITGSGFVAGTVARWNGADRTTQIVDNRTLRVTIPATDLTAAGTAQVTVFIPSETGGVVSTPVTITITPPPNNPVPAITSVSPSSGTQGGAAFTLTVTGSNFVQGATVRWNGADRPTTFVSGTQVTAAIPATDIASAGTAQITVFNPTPGGGVSNAIGFVIGTVPAINAGGIVNGASFQANLPLAPGGIATLFGTNLATSTQVASTLPLPTLLAGTTSVTVNGVAAPLFFVSPTQINFQVPREVEGQTTVSVVVRAGGISSAPLAVSLAPFSPGIFVLTQLRPNQGAVLISGTSSIAAPVGLTANSRPVRRGEFIEIYATGLGPVTNPPVSGRPALASPLSEMTATPIVTIGGVQANVVFGGLTPGFVGLYQVNVEVPASAPAGDSVQVVITAGGLTSNTVNIAVQ